MKIQTVPVTPPGAPKNEATDVFMIEVTGPFDPTNKTLQEAREIAVRTGSAKLLESFNRSIERREFVRKE